jgi:hypothetical protein
MSDYRCWVCDTEYYKGEEKLLEECCSNVKKWFKEQNLTIEDYKKELEIIKQSVPEKYTVEGSIAGTVQNYISELELRTEEQQKENQRLLLSLIECKDQLHEWLVANNPKGWIDDLRKNNENLRTEIFRLKFELEKQNHTILQMNWQLSRKI